MVDFNKVKDYSTDLKIDPDALDVEWINQPSTYMKYAEAAADAKLEMDKAKTGVDVVRAEIDASIRMFPDKYTDGSKKPTEAQIAGIILVQDKYKEAERKYLEARHTYDLLQSAVRAFDQRKTALENLRALCLGQYFAGPAELRDLSKEVARREREKDTVRTIRERNKD